MMGGRRRRCFGFRRLRREGRGLVAALGLGFACPVPVSAKTTRVRTEGQLSGLLNTVQPGDVIEVAPGTYDTDIYLGRPGLDGMPVIIRGIVGADGTRPILRGGDNTVTLESSHVVFESLEVTGGTQRCIYVIGNDIILRDVVVHDCPGHGIHAADEATGTLVIDRSEVYRSGGGEYDHQIYVTTDQETFPGAVFRLQHSYVHDATGGNNIKSRAERNEIYFNWIEGARYHELELIGPDVDRPPPGIREDSDVVGNVLRKTNGDSHGVRLGGDATMDTNGRYRLVHNTFWMRNGAMSPVRLFDGVESLELYNNVFFVDGGQPTTLLRTARVKWARGAPLILGSHNFIPPGSTAVPPALTDTIASATGPGFVSLTALDLRPRLDSPLVDAATPDMATHPEAPFPSGLAVTSHQPRRWGLRAPRLRAARGSRPDVGAFETGPMLEASETAVDGALHLPRGATSPPPLPPAGRCGCRVVGQRPPASALPPAALWGCGLVVALLGRRRRRRWHRHQSPLLQRTTSKPSA
ncbi:MAG: hypothetical protein AAGN82_00445 [Myxococcota bacterium]